MKKFIKFISYLLLTIITIMLIISWLFFYPFNIPKGVNSFTINKGEGIFSLLTKLKNQNIIINYRLAYMVANILNLNKSLQVGEIDINANKISIYEVLKKIKQGPEKINVLLLEGSNFTKIRKQIDSMSHIKHDTIGMSDQEILLKINPDDKSANLEGLLFPSTYRVYKGISDIDIYKQAYFLMEKKLNHHWDNRKKNLPLKNKYELLVLASLIEKETAIDSDRRKISAVFVNRLNKGMLLQTDPTVIYAMGDSYNSKITKKDLQIDSVYNTYKFKGLPPTPIALPSLKSIAAAANPEDVDYLYFVSKQDGTKESYFSKNLSEHNAAVRKYILKKE